MSDTLSTEAWRGTGPVRPVLDLPSRSMTLGIVVFGAAFLVGLGLGTYTRRPLSTAFLVLGSFSALLVLSATGEVLSAAAVLTIVFLLGLVAETMRETVGLLVGARTEGRRRLLGAQGRGKPRPDIGGRLH